MSSRTSPTLKPAFLLAGVLLVAIAGAVASQFFVPGGSAEFHTGAEAVATVLAFIVGVSLLTRYAIVGGSKVLLLGLGFTGTGVLDGYHTIVTSAPFMEAFPSEIDSLIPWSWMGSRLLLGTMFLLVALDLPLSRFSDQRSNGALILGTVVAAFTVLTLLFFAAVPLPKAYFESLLFGRPQELVPAAMFLAAFIVLLRAGNWSRNSYDLWVLVAVMINLLAQTFFMPFSHRLFDYQFDMAHVFKILSYLAMFTAVMAHMKRTILSEHQATGQLDALEILRSVSAHEASPDSMFPVVAEQVAKLVDYDRLTISTTNSISGPNRSMTLVYQSGVKMLDRTLGSVMDRTSSDRTKTSFTEPILEDDVTVGEHPDLDAAAVDLRAWAEVPLITNGEVVGMLSVRSRRAGAYSKRDLDLLQSAAGYLAPMLRNTFMVNEMLKSEQQLMEQALDLRNSNESLEQFAYIASHDLQEPLRKVSAFGDRLRTALGTDLPEKADDYLTRMITATSRMQDLVQGLLAFSRVRSADVESVPTDLNRVTEGAQDSLALAISEANVQFEISRLGSVSGNETQLRQVFVNLILNSIRYSRPGVAPEIKVTATRKDDMISIRFSDNGQGFEPQYAEQIFEIFKRLHTREEIPGTGLGLALCRRIIDKHGGKITATGRPGVGAVFDIRLPAAQITSSTSAA